MHDAVEHLVELAGKRRLASQGFVKHRAQRVDVAAAVEGQAEDLLGGEVGKGARQLAGAGEAGIGRFLSEAKIHNPHPQSPFPFAGHHEVFGFDVAVHDIAGVAVVERFGDLDEHIEDFAEGEAPFPQQIPQGLAFQHGHDKKKSALMAAKVEDRHDGRMVHLGDDGGFALKTQLVFRRGQKGWHQLDGDLPAQQGVAGPVDHAAPAPAKLGEDFIPFREAAADQEGGSPEERRAEVRPGC